MDQQHQHLLAEGHEHTLVTTATNLVEDYDMEDLKGKATNKAISGRWRAASFILGYEVCERMSYFGIATNLVVYLTEKLHEGTVESARNVNNWRAAIWMTPVLGAYLADTFLGRFSTIVVFSFIYLLGMGLLTMAVSLPSLKPPPCDELSGKDRGMSLLQRIGIGMFIQFLAMAVAAMVEKRRLLIAFEHDFLDSPHATIPMSIFWLLPQFLLMGIADTFFSIAILEFFYDQAPMNMKSIGTAIYTTNMGVGYFLSSLLITGVTNLSSWWSGGSGWLVDNLNRSNLDYYYWFLALLIIANNFLFLLIAKCYKYKCVDNTSTYQVLVAS